MEKVLNTDLVTVAGGAAEELFQRELRRVLENLMDVNTVPDKDRVINLKFKLRMDPRRSDVTVVLEATSKLQAPVGAVTHFQVSTDKKGVPVAHEPETLPFDDPAN